MEEGGEWEAKGAIAIFASSSLPFPPPPPPDRPSSWVEDTPVEAVVESVVLELEARRFDRLDDDFRLAVIGADFYGEP